MARMLSTREAAEVLGVSQSTIRRLIAEKRLAAVKIKQHWRIYADSVEAFLETRSNVGVRHLMLAEVIG